MADSKAALDAAKVEYDRCETQLSAILETVEELEIKAPLSALMKTQFDDCEAALNNVVHMLATIPANNEIRTCEELAEQLNKCALIFRLLGSASAAFEELADAAEEISREIDVDFAVKASAIRARADLVNLAASTGRDAFASMAGICNKVHAALADL